MAHPFEITKQIEVDATPEQVWDAITTGPGIDSWFMGRNEVEPRVGGTARTVHPGFTMEATVTAWEPPTRFAVRTPEGEDGSLSAFEYRVDDRGSGGSVVQWVHTGAIAGDWEAEYEAMGEGDPMYFHKLEQYLTYFLGRTGRPIDAFGPPVADREHAWEVFRRGLGLPGPVALGDRVTLTPEGLDPIEGVVDYFSPSFLGVRSQDGIFRFIYAFTGSVMLGHHDFSEGGDHEATAAAWQSWIDRTFG
jgi:uncharacterized protein YndB with AHSA1/START domain